MNVSDLNERFALEGVLEFEVTPTGMTVAQVNGPAARATIYFQGAHLTEWTPAGSTPALYLSSRSEFEPGKPIRGGIPVIFPWFGPRSGEPSPPHADKLGPSHGFARICDWELAFAAIAGEEVHLTFALLPTELSRQFGYDGFRLALRMSIGRTLRLELTVANEPGSAPLTFEEALHTYFAVAESARASVLGLGGVTYIDKRDGFQRKLQPDGAITFSGTTDRVYLDTVSTCVIEDPAGGRRIVVEKAGSATTVVWNPWAEMAATLPDMDPEGWHGMVCVETANVAGNLITVAPGATHTMSVLISVEETG